MIKSDIVVASPGVNWSAFIAFIASLAGIGGFIVAWLERRTRAIARFNTETAKAIADAIDHQTEVLMAKLETKETVAGLAQRVARIEGIEEERKQT